MKILLLGGTGFLGRAISAETISRRHDLTCLARGHGQVVDGATLVHADRDHDDSLAEVSVGDWDAVVDLTSHPLHAKRSVRDLNSQHWVYISSSSVYVRGDILEQVESAPIADALDSDFMVDMTRYGAAKVSCESIYRDHSSSHTIIRPGLIGGDGDYTGRSGYYPWRFAHPSGEDVLVPDPTFPTALIDVNDLAAWIVDCAEQRHVGTFNATGKTTSLFEVLDLSQKITASTAVPRIVENEVLAKYGVSPWMGRKSLPL